MTLPNRERNWLEFLAVLDATLPPMSDSPGDDANVNHTVEHSRELFTKVSEEDGIKDRSGQLALLELEHRARKHCVTQGGIFFIFCRCILLILYRPKSDGPANERLFQNCWR